jgi:hypothetical protein
VTCRTDSGRRAASDQSAHDGRLICWSRSKGLYCGVMSRHECIDCTAEISGRREMCDECRRLWRNNRQMERDRAKRAQAPVVQKVTGESVDYSRGGLEQPWQASETYESYRSPSSHDRERWLREKALEEVDDDDQNLPYMLSWNALQDREREVGTFVNFATREPVDSVSLGRRGGRPISNPAALGDAYGSFSTTDMMLAAGGQAVRKPAPRQPSQSAPQRTPAFILPK